MGISVLNPEVFQGNLNIRDYFEGWYYKLTKPGRERAISLIPGVSTARGDAHAFIQVIDSKDCRTEYIRFPLACFTASKKELAVNIGGNTFYRDKIAVDLKGLEFTIRGNLSFYDIVPFPKKRTSPGIMGPFSFLPFMECNHGIVNIRHSITGSLAVNGAETDFSGGTGYIEKDWGRSFPSFWIWTQGHDANADFMFSIADIPFLGRRFTGIISFIYTQGRYYPLATYNGARLTQFSLHDETFCAAVENKKYRLALTVRRAKGGTLIAPARGLMRRDLEETLNAVAFVDLRQKDGSLVYAGSLANAGMEICGDLSPVYRLIKH
jgi:hypothetical protein